MSQVAITNKTTVEKTVVFVSGHMEGVDHDFFNLHYKPKLDEYMKKNDMVIVGDAQKGIDCMTQSYLSDQKYEFVKVYHMFSKPRANKGNWKTCGGFKSDSERDQAMTLDSKQDLAIVHPSKLIYKDIVTQFDITSIRDLINLLQQKHTKNSKTPRISGTEKNILRRHLFMLTK